MPSIPIHLSSCSPINVITGFCIYDPIFQWIQESIWTKDLLSLEKVKDIMYDISLFYAQFKFVEVRYKKSEILFRITRSRSCGWNRVKVSPRLMIAPKMSLKP